MNDGRHYLGIDIGGTKCAVLSPPDLPGWDAVPIVQLANKVSQLLTYLMNYANAGALAEGMHGAGRNCDNFAFLSCGTGMGSGIVCNGQILEGTNGFAGEIGHMRLTVDGPIGTKTAQVCPTQVRDRPTVDEENQAKDLLIFSASPRLR